MEYKNLFNNNSQRNSQFKVGPKFNYIQYIIYVLKNSIRNYGMETIRFNYWGNVNLAIFSFILYSHNYYYKYFIGQ